MLEPAPAPEPAPVPAPAPSPKPIADADANLPSVAGVNEKSAAIEICAYTHLIGGALMLPLGLVPLLTFDFGSVSGTRAALRDFFAGALSRGFAAALSVDPLGTRERLFAHLWRLFKPPSIKTALIYKLFCNFMFFAAFEYLSGQIRPQIRFQRETSSTTVGKSAPEAF